MSEFLARRRGLIEELKEAASSISISFDVWTSPSMTPILGICSHFITSKSVRRRVLLGLKEIQGRHTAKTLALVLEATLIEYGIKHRLGYTMSDNATIAWRNNGSLGKVRNNITWFRDSGQRKQQFGETKVADESDNLQSSKFQDFPLRVTQIDHRSRPSRRFPNPSTPSAFPEATAS
ncbi:hypothetical protein E4U52_006825 [Claviceps spartinae]|nr:hypothetical protein E4U52_006825 [Claviceps spartinae]